MWDLRSPTRGWTPVPCTGKWIPEHWTTKEGPESYFCRIKNSGLTAVPLLYISEKTKTVIWKETLHTHTHTNTAATAAKSLQSCPTLCDPTDGRPPGSPVPEILQARTLEWVAISLSKKRVFLFHFPLWKRTQVCHSNMDGLGELYAK